MRALKLWVPAVGAALLLTACSSSHSGDSGGTAASSSPGTFSSSAGSAAETSGDGVAIRTPTTIAQALAGVPLTDWDTGYLEFGEPKTVLAMDGGKPASGPLSAYSGVGETYFMGRGVDDNHALGFDLNDADVALTVGVPGRQAAIVYGTFDAFSVGSTLGKGGFKRQGTADGAALWTIGDNHQTNDDNPTGVPELNVMLVSSSRIVAGGAGADVKAVGALPGSSISTVAAVAAVADCLGPARAAVISPENNLPQAPTVGIGLLADSGADGHEELCVAVPDALAGSALTAHLKSVIATGRSHIRDEPWSKLLIDPDADVLPAVNGVITVRLTAKPGPAGQVGTLLFLHTGGPDVNLGNLIGE